MKEKIKLRALHVLSKLRRRLLGPYATGVVYRTQNGTLALPADDLAIGRHLGFGGAWDAPEIAEVSALVGADDVVYVVGTHVGTLLVPLARRCREVIGYEANPDTFFYLRANVFLNEIENARLFNYAVGDAAKQVSFYQNKVNSGGSKIKPLREDYRYRYDNPGVVTVDMVGLDAHVREEELPPPDGIVMDIEGAEYFALQGMPEALGAARFLYIEYVPHHLDNVSGTDDETFFSLVLPHFRRVRFVRKGIEVDLQKAANFWASVAALRHAGQSDDLLFVA